MKKENKILIKSYSAKVIQSQVIYLKTQINGMRIDNDIEFLHHTRVMSRRIRSTIEVFSPYFGKKNSLKWYESIQDLTKSLTRIRDLDVQIYFLEMQLSGNDNNNLHQGISRLLLRKKQNRLKGQKNVLSTINNFEDSNTLEEIIEFIERHPFDEQTFYPPKELVSLAKHKINDQVRICFFYVPFITNPNNVSELHNLRIGLKNLRYTAELFEPIYPDLKEFINVLKIFQDDLGRIHDNDIWILDLNKFLEKEKIKIQKFYGQIGTFNFIKPGIEYLQKLVINDRISLYETFLDHWNTHFQQQYWSRLRDQIVEYPELDNNAVDEFEQFGNSMVEPENDKIVDENN